jgi:hypothetical protein
MVPQIDFVPFVLVQLSQRPILRKDKEYRSLMAFSRQQFSFSSFDDQLGPPEMNWSGSEYRLSRFGTPFTYSSQRSINGTITARIFCIETILISDPH